VIHPLVRAQIHRAGLRLLPMTSFLACALGLVIIGQMVALLTRVGAQNFAGTVMVTVVVRELGPLVAASLVLARAGAAYVIELGTARALGGVEAVEGLWIGPAAADRGSVRSHHARRRAKRRGVRSAGCAVHRGLPRDVNETVSPNATRVSGGGGPVIELVNVSVGAGGKPDLTCLEGINWR